MSRRGPLSGALARVVLPLAGVLVLVRMMAAEEARPDPRAFRRLPSPDGLPSAEEDYVTWAGGHIQWLIAGARVRSIRFTAVALVSGASALSITLAVAVHAPGWVPAVLGFLAALGQYVQSLSRDREQAHLAHQEAVRLQKTLRDFHTDAGALSGRALRDRFAEFKRRFDDIKEEYGAEMLKVRSQEPPRIPSGQR